MTLAVLDADYPGDARWDAFAAAVMSMPRSTAKPVVFPFEFCEEKLALVLGAIMGDRAPAWMVSPCEALEMRTPFDVLENERSGLKILRHLLMRMP